METMLADSSACFTRGSGGGIRPLTFVLLEGAGDLVLRKLVISRVLIRVTPFRAVYTSTYNLLTKSPAPSSRV